MQQGSDLAYTVQHSRVFVRVLKCPVSSTLAKVLIHPAVLYLPYLRAKNIGKTAFEEYTYMFLADIELCFDRTSGHAQISQRLTSSSHKVQLHRWIVGRWHRCDWKSITFYTMPGAHQELILMDLPEGILPCILSALPVEQLISVSKVSLMSDPFSFSLQDSFRAQYPCKCCC